MRTLAIGDIHGCFRALKCLESSASISMNDQVITLGDHVDRGTGSREVIDWMINRHQQGGLIALIGNHELMMLAASQSESHNREWLGCGGQAVLDSYGVSNVSEVPQIHLDFLRNSLRRYHTTPTHLYVHANVYPELALADQPSFMLHWDSTVERPKHSSGKVLICGHTPQRNGVPLDLGHAVCIDTAACRGGWLTCLDVDARFCWQANEDGETREFWLDQGPEWDTALLF